MGLIITYVRNAMRLKTLGLINYHVKLNFFDLICYLVYFFNKFDRIICISNVYYLKETLILTNVKYFCCQSDRALKGCFLAICQLDFNAFSHFSEVSLQIIYQFMYALPVHHPSKIAHKRVHAIHCRPNDFFVERFFDG